MPIIKFNDVWEMYRIKFSIDKKVSWENFWALQGISFDVEKGKSLGIIGENGAGKSTVLKLIAGMLKPDRGDLFVSGSVSGLLELGAGFDGELTGKENLLLNASLFGLNPSQIGKKYDDIVNFANIGRFINAPVKCYSQGMFVRLAFSLAIHMDPDIFLIDDTLAVGDEYFQRKCSKKIFELKEQGKTIVFVTHDMNMLKRLCERVIFLRQGKVMKDGLIEKVTPFYTQVTGTRPGVGIIEKKPLQVVFNNGRFFINWHERQITHSSGSYTSFIMADKWYNSIQAEWEVKKESENKLEAVGRFYQLSLIQIYKLEILENLEIKLDITIESDAAVEIQEGYTTIMLTEEYTHWFTGLEEGVFPVIEESNKDMLVLLGDNLVRKCIGVRVNENSENKHSPSLIFEKDKQSFSVYAQIANANYITNCRILQYKAMGLRNFSADQSNFLNYFSGKIALGMPDIRGYLRKSEDEFVISNGKLKLSFDKGRIILYYDDMVLTMSGHINTAVYTKQRPYCSETAQWEIFKVDKNKLRAEGAWAGAGFTQLWEVEITNEETFLWKISLCVNEEVEIEGQRAQFVCSEKYKYWFSEYETGEFPDKFIEVEEDMPQRCISYGDIGIKGVNGQAPALVLKFSNELDNFGKIFNSDFYHKARILRVEKINPEIDVKIPPGTYQSFAIQAFLDKQKELPLTDTAARLKNDRLGFVFDKGRGRIYWDQKELTKKLGLYTSLRSERRWHDSASSAVWKIEESRKDMIRVSGKWLYLPIIQYWTIKLKENWIIEFNAAIKAEKAVEIDRAQTSLMVLEKYSRWTADGNNGIFPLFKKDIGDDWDCIHSTENGSGCVAVSGGPEHENELPSIVFFPETALPGNSLNVLNSDIYHRGRVLQYSNQKKTIILPGEYAYFHGNISFKTKVI